MALRNSFAPGSGGYGAVRLWGGLGAIATAIAGCLGSPPQDSGGQTDLDATTETGLGMQTDGSIDATTASDDSSTGPGADGGSVGIDASGPAACVAGNACSPAECQLGTTVCGDGGTASCSSSMNAMNGTSCDAGADAMAVCNNGSCGTCRNGADCTEAGSCQAMTVSCTSGSAVCTAAGTVNDGTSCGTNLYCNKGACAACTAGASCVPAGKPCNAGKVSCSAGQIVCTDQQTAAANGTSCGTNEVCNNGQCVSCTANVVCTPTANACHTGLTSCATGASVCSDQGAGQNGVVCGTNMTCTSGSCGCTAATKSCSGACVNETNDSANCGACAHKCVVGTCAGSSCPAWSVAPANGTKTSSPRPLASDGTNVVWLDGSGNVLEAPVGGGTPVTLSTSATSTAQCIGMANGVVAWTGYVTGTMTIYGIIYTAVEGVPGSQSNLAATNESDPNATFAVSGLALTSTGGGAYFINDAAQGNVEACTIGGIAPTCTPGVSASGGLRTDDILINGSMLFWTGFGSGSVFEETLGSSSVVTVASSETGPFLIAADSTYVYWANYISGTAFSIDRNVRSSPNATASQSVVAATGSSITGLATDGQYVYLAGQIGAAEVAYVPVAGGTPKMLYALPSGGKGANGLVLAKGALYWIDMDANVVRGITTPP
jgi:hypothetical protein